MKKMMIVLMCFFATAAFASETATTEAQAPINTNPSALVRKAKKQSRRAAARAKRRAAKKHGSAHSPATEAPAGEAPAGEAPSH